MNVEIEAKFKVDALEPVEQRLQQLDAAFVGEYHQRDDYLDNKDGRLMHSDQCLRLRYDVGITQEHTVLTYKGPKQRHDLKKRLEIEMPVPHPESMLAILSALGYSSILVIEKNRRIWRLHECFVALDRLPVLGTFVEIEGPTGECIAEVQRDLGLSDKKHIAQSYAHLVREYLSANSLGDG
jgi:adenylate cyclase class 2